MTYKNDQPWGYTGIYYGDEPLTDFSFLDLFNAYLDCRSGKRNTDEQLRFETSLSINLYKLYDDLKEGSYYPGQHKCFVVQEPKPREVWASFFRDRIVHHLVYNATASRFHRSFIHDSFSCIPGKGTHKGQKRLQRHILSSTKSMTRDSFYASMDIERYFNTISHDRVFSLLNKKILSEEGWLKNLWHKIIFNDIRESVIVNSSPQEMRMITPEKSIFNAPPGVGLAAGNLTNQFLANVNCNPFDHFIKRRLGCKHYVRYVDDFVILSNDRSQLSSWMEKIDSFLVNQQGQKLHYGKTKIGLADSGIDFVGANVFPYHMQIRKRIQRKAFHKINQWRSVVEKESFILSKDLFTDRFHRIRLPDLVNTVNSYAGMARQVNGFQWALRLAEEAEMASAGYLYISFRYKPDGRRFPIVKKYA